MGVWGAAVGWFGSIWGGTVGVVSVVAGWFGGVFRGAWNAIVECIWRIRAGSEVSGTVWIGILVA